VSLNNAEIDLVLQELDLPGHSIQKVIQNDFRNLYLQLFRPPRAWWLRVCLEHPRVRFHATAHPPRGSRSRQRFEDFLHARVRGGRITRAEHLFRDRIVRLEILHNGVTTWMYLRLWGTRSNVVLTDPAGTVLDACFRKPAEGFESGGSFTPTPPETNSERAVREYPAGQTFNTFLDEEYRLQERREERDRREKECARILERRRNRLKARLQEISHGQERSADADQYRHYGELILAFLHRSTPGAAWLDVEDYERDNQPVRISLDPARSAAENAQAYFEKASRARNSEEFLTTTAHNLRTSITAVESQLAQIPTMTVEELREMADELRQASRSDARGRAGGAGTIGLEFESNGFQILVGRNARENDHLLRRSVRGNDWWLHTRDVAGGYVFIRARKNRSVPLEVLLDAGNLAVFFSKARKGRTADLYYTQVKYLRRARGGPAGLVLPTQEKNITIELDDERLRSLGIGSDLNFSTP
jgi:predicted ribosome quality control (RQC) complex YloA/Tae2 family protein